MVEIAGMEFGSGYVLFAASYSDEAIDEAKKYCKQHGLTPQTVTIKTIRKKDCDEPELVVVTVL